MKEIVEKTKERKYESSIAYREQKKKNREKIDEIDTKVA